MVGAGKKEEEDLTTTIGGDLVLVGVISSERINSEKMDERDPGGGFRDNNSGSSAGGLGNVGSSVSKEQEVAQKSGTGSQDSGRATTVAVGQIMPQ